jgi:hypothetical protein
MLCYIYKEIRRYAMTNLIHGTDIMEAKIVGYAGGSNSFRLIQLKTNDGKLIDITADKYGNLILKDISNK